MVVALPPRSQKAPSAAVLMLSAELMLPRRSPPPRRSSLRRAHAAASCRGCDAPASRPKLRPDLTALSAAPLRTRTSDQQSHAALRERPRRESFVALSSQHEGRVSARRGPPSKIPVAVLTLDPDRGTTPTCGSRESIESDPSFLVSKPICCTTVCGYHTQLPTQVPKYRSYWQATLCRNSYYLGFLPHCATADVHALRSLRTQLA